MPASPRSFAVPPVESISTPSSASPRASSTRPRLSLTLTNARPILAIAQLLHVDARHAPPDRRQYLVRDRVAPLRQLVGADRLPTLAAEEHDRLARLDLARVGHVDHGVVHADAARDRRAAPAHQHAGA